MFNISKMSNLKWKRASDDTWTLNIKILNNILLELSIFKYQNMFEIFSTLYDTGYSDTSSDMLFNISVYTYDTLEDAKRGIIDLSLYMINMVIGYDKLKKISNNHR